MAKAEEFGGDHLNGTFSLRASSFKKMLKKMFGLSFDRCLPTQRLHGPLVHLERALENMQQSMCTSILQISQSVGREVRRVLGAGGASGRVGEEEKDPDHPGITVDVGEPEHKGTYV